jgi:hypothetical protein
MLPKAYGRMPSVGVTATNASECNMRPRNTGLKTKMQPLVDSHL